MATRIQAHAVDADGLVELGWRVVAHEHRLLVAHVDAGFPSPAADDLKEPIDLGQWLVEHPAAIYVMRVAGHSMAAANSADGDHVVVDRSVEAGPGHIVVAIVHGDRTMKRLRRRDGRLWLLPEPAVGFFFPEIIVGR